MEQKPFFRCLAAILAVVLLAGSLAGCADKKNAAGIEQDPQQTLETTGAASSETTEPLAQATDPSETEPAETESTEPAPTETKPTATEPPATEPVKIEPPAKVSGEIINTGAPSQEGTTTESEELSFLMYTPNGTKVRVGETLQLKFDYTGKEGTLFFAVDDTAFAQVDGNGLVTGVSEGLVHIEVYIVNEDRYILWDWLALFVVGANESTEADPLNFVFRVSNGSRLPVGMSVQLDYAFGGTADLLKFEVDDPSVATVDRKGVLTGVSSGLVYVYAYAWDGAEYTYRDFVVVAVVEENIPQSKPDDTVISGQLFALNLNEIRIGDIELTWPVYTTNQKNADGTPVTVYYNLYVADTDESPFYLDCERWEENAIYMAGFPLNINCYFKVRAYILQDGVEKAMAESEIRNYTAHVNESVYTSSNSWNFNQAQMEEARKVAKSIADSIMADPGLTTDLARIAKAAKIINDYAAAADYVTSGTYYNTPYGVLVAGEQSCAGCVRALGLILEYMGFYWGHVNPNAWEHQWCVVYDVDGQTAFADGSWIGVAGYGSWLYDRAYQYVEGTGLVDYSGSRPFCY